VDVEAGISGAAPRSASGETLTAPKVDSVNTFEAPETVAPRPAAVTVAGGKVSLSLPPRSVTVVSVKP
jgi:alpha-N-arabinofuranosidase